MSITAKQRQIRVAALRTDAVAQERLAQAQEDAIAEAKRARAEYLQSAAKLRQDAQLLEDAGRVAVRVERRSFTGRDQGSTEGFIVRLTPKLVIVHFSKGGDRAEYPFYREGDNAGRERGAPSRWQTLSDSWNIDRDALARAINKAAELAKGDRDAR